MASVVADVKGFAELLKSVSPGHWVALSRDESAVLATDPDLGIAIQRAKDAGETEPLCYFKPDESEGLFVY